MPMRVHVHAAIWLEDRLVVHRHTTRGQEHITLPGGRVREREDVLTALQREVGEETGLDIEIGGLCLAGEVHGTSAHDLVLVFGAQAVGSIETSELNLLDPRSAEAKRVRPSVVDLLVASRTDPSGGTAPGAASWAGNLYEPGRP